MTCSIEPANDFSGTEPEFQAPLRITEGALERVLGHARGAAPEECMGLLASRSGDPSRVITRAVRLRAQASEVRAEADPQSIAEVVARLRRRAFILRGCWHSHGDGEVHHSKIDDTTMRRLLPAMADENFERPAPTHLAPTVIAPDEAWLPLEDGRAHIYSLIGPPIAGFDAHETARWASVTTRFHERSVTPRAVRRGGRLNLYGGTVLIALGVPDHATLRSQLVEASALRVATMFSLVVNIQGATYGEALTVRDIDGRTFTDMGPCAVEVLGRRSTTAVIGQESTSSNGRVSGD